MATWQSIRRPALDAIVAAGPSAAGAVTSMIDFEEARGVGVPPIYVSTAITSAGHRREPGLQDPAGIPEAVERNNRSAALIMEALATYQPHLVDAGNVMVPTELGKVRGWKDTDYLQFYFAWLGGLTASGSAWYCEQLADPTYASILAAADRRELSNQERWPAYKVFAEIAVAKVAQARRRRDALRSEGSTMLLQLVDVEESLGCRAESLFAEILELDVIAPTFADRIDPNLDADLRRLSDLGATVGRLRAPAEIVPLRIH